MTLYDLDVNKKIYTGYKHFYIPLEMVVRLELDAVLFDFLIQGRSGDLQDPAGLSFVPFRCF